jgi:VWFA-related protein
MKNSRSLSPTTLVVAAHLCAFALSGSAHGALNSDEVVFDRAFTQKFSAIAIENPNGRTEVETWNSNRVRVTAVGSARPGKVRPLDSRIRFQITNADTLRIIVRDEAAEEPINLSVYVPRQINLSVKGDTEAIAVRGSTAGLIVETESGPISLSLALTANIDLSMRSLEGIITSKLEMRVFGPLNAHSLDGRIGRGGTPVILRSVRGAVELLADEPARIAKADRRLNDPAKSTEPPVVDYSNFESVSNTSSDRAAARLLLNNSNVLASTPTGTTTRVIYQTDPAVADVIKIDTRLVNLNVKVTDSSGKLIPDLTRNDFQVFEENIEQEVVRFEPVTSPVSVVLLLDASGSTKERWKVIKKAARKFVDTLSADTPIALAAFTRKFLVISDFTTDRTLMKKRIDDTKNLQSGTAFYDAAWSALNLFKEINEQRKAIVVMTDGVDNSLSSDEYEPRHPFDELMARLAQDEVTIYPIYFDTEYEVTVKHRGNDTHESYVTAREQLQRIADETGGTFFKADQAEDLAGVYQRVASELQTLYSVSYNPNDKNYNGDWRNVAVKVKRAQAVARTKRGFYAR